MSILYLLRHGITEGNEKRLYYGATDLHLTQKGIDEIDKRKNNNIYPDKSGYILVTSALVRTSETLERIYGETDHIKDKRLNEIDFGDFEMKSYEELKDDPSFISWCEGDNWSNICPNGESGQEMIRRAEEAFDDYIGKNCIIVCHGGIIASFMMKWFPDEPDHDHFYSWQPRPCEGYEVEFDSDNKPLKFKSIVL